MLQERVNGQTLPQNCHPRHTTRKEDKVLYRQQQETPFMQLHTLHAIIAPQIHFDTMQRQLQEAHMQMWQRVNRPALSVEAAAQRLAWALQYWHWMVEDWGRVLWSKECSVEKNSGVSSRWVYRTLQDKWRPDLIQPFHQSGRISIMVWAAFSAYGRSPLVICEGDPQSARSGVTGRSY